MIIGRDELNGISSMIDASAFEELALDCQISEDELVEFLQSEYLPGRINKFTSNKLVNRMYAMSHHDYQMLEHELDKLYSMLRNSLSENAKKIRGLVRQRMADVEVIYLPTYRRIERPLLRPRRTTMPYPNRGGRSRADYHDMAFGLTDVEERLAEISEEIERRSNIGYRALSTKILEELLKGLVAPNKFQKGSLPNADSLFRFLGRVGNDVGNISGMHEDIMRLYESGEIEQEVNWFLHYFLIRLAEVIDQTKEMEGKVEKFVLVCNGYLRMSGDEKKLSFDPNTLKVVVEDLWAKCSISLDDLSSGEKQIVSLMARLYLSEKPKIVLMDEPELSLSIEWQKRVLPDVVKSGTVAQMLAITHSPFVFENELDDFARPLEIKRTGRVE